MKAVDRVLALITKRTGMEVSTLGGLPVILKAMELSREEAGMTTLDEWADSLDLKQEVWQAFLHRIIVPETFFFRYPESYQALTEWVRRYPKRPLRVLSLPCSTGEETYSIAICLQRAGLASAEFSVTGFDINAPSVAVARKGIYRHSAFRGVVPPAQERFFEPFDDQKFRVASHVRREVLFEEKNFWDVSVFEESYDVIFCRNLLIYFPPERQISALQKIGSMLRTSGLLFLGPAEVPLACQNGWKSAGFPMSFACEKAESNRPASPIQFFQGLSAPVRTRPVVTRISRPAGISRPTPAAAAAPVTPAAPEPTLEYIRSLADRGALEEAQATLDQYHRRQPADAESYYLGGLLAETIGERTRAENLFRKALYLSPSHPEAISHLALLLRADGRIDASRKLLARAERLNAP
ncbi:methyltransferase domain-containing protein [Luteolibacter pohnpeiensis]|uniref:Methyltransferase domain-containing protein n=1 Tax=Luteolibacter pohnpeiensis TaxID=454153 RepID=A0A934VXW4_9BACT|nr:CheR family methyltransferase [Luteolibacter pohnpeiensis]MBK1883909.1 methyltransferase domain-containing protein [Luteolibacter pohnpeiensis]